MAAMASSLLRRAGPMSAISCANFVRKEMAARNFFSVNTGIFLKALDVCGFFEPEFSGLFPEELFRGVVRRR